MTTQFHGWKQWAKARATGFGLLIGLVAGAERAAAQSYPQPQILKLYNTANPAQDSVFALDGYITLEVSGLSRYIRQQESLLRQQGVAPDKAHAQARKLVLYINDAPLIGMPPESMHTVPAADAPGPAPDSSQRALADTLTKIIYHLTRRQSTNPYWNVVYNSPWEFAHPGKIGLGYDDRVITNMYPQAGEPIRLKLVRPVALAVALLVVGLLAVCIVVLGRKSWLLRNSVPNWNPADGQVPMFSLAKSQLAWWTFLVLGSYLLIYCVTGEMTNISTTTLELLGISAGTAGIGSLIGQPATGATAPQPPPSRGWWLDVLSDDQGVSIHRLQQVGFTLLLGYLFIRTVYKTVALPEWNDNEILLLGISSATYLGLKSQENKPTDDQAEAGGDKTKSDFGALAKNAAGPAPTVVAEAPATPATPATAVTVNVGAAPTTPDATAEAATTAPAATGSPAQSSADPVTGAVQFRAEDDMGPDAPPDGPDATTGPVENPNQIPG